MEIIFAGLVVLSGAYASNRIAKWRGFNERNMTSAGVFFGPAAILFGLFASNSYATSEPSADLGDVILALMVWLAVIFIGGTLLL